ncbi:MAG: D-alanine--D-alanine ligase [Planctomycetes bacterium]|nr:D-alanine--D-alanine ligase [Planctomycetota bacterium]
MVVDIAVLAGGRSPEHDISLRSVAQVLAHLDRSRWRWPVFLDRDGGWWPDRQPLSGGTGWTPGDPARARGPQRPGTALDFLLDHAQVQVALPILHGPFGEDGTVQGLLELHDLPCVGSGSAASAVAMDKIRTRQVLETLGVPMARGYVPRTPLLRADAAVEFAQLRAAVGLPAFVKVDCSGSTVGVQPVRTEAELAAFFAEFRGRFRRWFAEAQLVGEEITVGVLGNTGDVVRALPAVGIYPVKDRFFTIEAKYTPGATEEVIPPRGMSPAQIRVAQELAVTCHEALVCDGVSRTDMIVDHEGPKVLEVNTIPGMTGTSLLPQAAAAAGLPFPALLDHLLELALARAGRPVAARTAR